MNSDLNWVRFWCPRGGTVHLDWSGYLSDPRDEYASIVQPDLVSADTFEGYPCVVLLGEPGIGKSSEMRRLFAGSSDDTGGTLFRNLHQYDTTSVLRDDLFRSDEFRSWESSDRTITLALDSLDEALLEIRVLTTWLIEQLKRLPTDRLRLRIACRTAEWPPLLEGALTAIWGEANVRVFELAPLTDGDVRLAAEARGLDGDAFLTEVARREVSALANKPATLRFLLSAFARHQTLPQGKTELYGLGCLHLCEEDEERRLSGRAGRLTADERLAVARRIAAATVFGNRAAVSRVSDPGDTASAEVHRRELVGGSEPVLEAQRISVSERELNEALGTGLFSGRGDTSMGWAHQTYAEYLAAQWIVKNGLSMPQIESLIRHPLDSAFRFIPQLHETIVWLAGISAEVRALVLETQPELLLKSDVERLAEEDRAALVQALLDASARAQLPWPEFGTPRRYDRFDHPHLAEQLRPYVLEASWPQDTRELALEIAAGAKVASLQAECADLALDRSAPLAVRVEAARVVATAGDAETRARLLPLAVEPQPEDEEDDLKGTALRSVWPDHLAAEQLFEALTFPKRANRSGSYDRFMSQVEQTVDPADLPVALRWATDAAESLTVRGHLAAAIIRMGWEHADQREVMDAFAQYAIKRFGDYRDLFPNDVWSASRGDETLNPFAGHSDRRRRLVEALVECIALKEDVAAQRLTRTTAQQLVDREDLDWLIARTVAASDDEVRSTVWARLARAIVRLTDPDDFARIYEVRDCPAVAATFSGYWTAIPLDSELAATLRQQQAEDDEWQTQRERAIPAPDLPSAERVHAMLNDAGAENSHRSPGAMWCPIAQEMTRSEDGLYYRLGDIDQGPTWRLLDHEGRLRLLDEAEQFVRSYASSVQEWTADGASTMGVWAGYRGLRLLTEHDPDRLQSLPSDVWSAWIPVIVREHPFSDKEDDVERYRSLLTKAATAVRTRVVAAIAELLLGDAVHGRGHWALDRFDAIWNADLAIAILEVAQRPDLPPASLQTLLELLLERDTPGAPEFAQTLLTPPIASRGRPRARALAAAAALLLKAPDRGWTSLQRIISGKGKFRRELALSAAHRSIPLDRFSEEQLADFVTWLMEEFPYPDPWYVGVYSPSPEDEARRLRSDTLRALEARATPEAVHALGRLRRVFPSFGWLAQTILRTEEAVRRESWAAPGIDQILALATDAGRRLVETGEHLLNVLLESLDRLQGELQGELPSVSTLWDHQGGGKYRPKDEQELSDAMARHFRRDLKDRGVVAGREVVIRRGGAGGAPGQRTDVYVTAVRETPRGAESVAVIVEVKGSWHADVLTAMETQLADDYLARNPECRHGLFVVGWYTSGRWVNGPPKRRSARLGSLEALQERLDEQAAALTRVARHLRAYVLDVSWN
jgi:hypothetical protein